MPICTVCGQEKPTSDFSSSSRRACGYRNQCRKCDAQSTAWRRLNGLIKKPTPEKQYEYDLRKNYDLSLNQYKRMLESQNGGCAICGKCEPKLRVDHCHTTGLVRGLLCCSCNSALGLFGDSLDRLKIAVAYLGRSKEVKSAEPPKPSLQPAQ